MNIITEIREAFASLKMNRAIRIETLPYEYPAWVFRKADRFGVAVKQPSELIIAERFSNARLRTDSIEIDGRSERVITLTSNVDGLRNEFAVVCAQFVDPGIRGEQRKILDEQPYTWWRNWSSLLGNSIRLKQPTDVLGELITLKYLVKSGMKPSWIGHKGHSHDIEYYGGTIEVKSTVSRYGYMVKINSQFQMMVEKGDLQLSFVRFEPTINGVSINSTVEELIYLGYPQEELESALESLGYEYGMGVRSDCFSVIDAKLYPINDDFPKINRNSFADGKIPEGVVKIEYTVDLDNLMNSDFLDAI